jgi:serine protease AprX
MVAAALAAALTLATLLAVRSGSGIAPDPFSSGSQAGGAAPSATQSPLAQLAASDPGRQVEVIVQLRPGVSAAAGRQLVLSQGGSALRNLPIIHGLAARLSAARAQRLNGEDGVRAASLNTPIQTQNWGWKHRRWRHGGDDAVDDSRLASTYDRSIGADTAWNSGYTGEGVGVAVVDTGIAGNLPDFRASQDDSTSRVIASAVVNPAARTAGDSFGHGTHVAGLIAGDGTNRPSSDPLYGKYIGVAPDANLISVKAGDENGDATVLDVIDGLQFIVDHKADYNIRVVNLSLKSASAESYRTDPLDAAAEAVWNSGIVVVTASGNLGTASDAVSYAPANDPYVITVGAVDDKGTKLTWDDRLTSWSSRGTTQDGFAKPDVVAPGSQLASTIPPGSAYTQQCPSCITDGSYFKVGGTSMAAAVVSGAAADAIEAHPDWTPNQVKAQLVKRTRPVRDSSGSWVNGGGWRLRSISGDDTISGGEVALDRVLRNPLTSTANAGLTPNNLIDPATGQIDYSRASWSRASWSDAIDPLRASWSRASWSRASWSRASWSATPQSCSDFERASWSRASWSAADIASAQNQCEQLLASIDPTRASWSRASWSRASWSTSFDK